MNYPSPCLKCEREACKKNGSQFRECREWLTWFRWWWKRFRTYSWDEVQRKGDKLHYAHPDEIRRVLQRNPCEGCRAERGCEIPCRRYLAWYDARMEIVRKKAGM